MGSWKKRIEDEVKKKWVMTDPLLKKSHVHKDSDPDPTKVCRFCGGHGAVSNGHTNQVEECQACEGTGESYD